MPDDETLTALTLYRSRLGNHRLLSADEESRLIRRAQAGDREAREQLVLCNQRLVLAVARKCYFSRFFSGDLELMDLVQYGNLGLLEAVRRFDPGIGKRFATYATWWVTALIYRSSYIFGSSMSRSLHDGENILRVKRAEQELRQQLGRRPAAEEIAALVGYLPGKVREIQRHSRPCVRLDSFMDDDDRPESDISDGGEAVEDVVEENILVEQVRIYLDQLPGKRRYAVIAWLGLDDPTKQKTHRQIAADLGISRARVSLMVNDSISTLRTAFADWAEPAPA